MAFGRRSGSAGFMDVERHRVPSFGDFLYQRLMAASELFGPRFWRMRRGTRLFCFLPALLVAGLGGCGHAASVTAAGPEPAIIARDTRSAATQVKACYRRPKLRHEMRQITTRVAVKYAIDGSVIGLPQVVAQSGVTLETSVGASRMAEAAIRAIIACSPLRLPAETYRGGWEELELTFSPSARG